MWDEDEMETLSADTRLKLSQKYVYACFALALGKAQNADNRRNWFLERLLKLGSIDVKKEYLCVSFRSQSHPLCHNSVRG